MTPPYYSDDPVVRQDWAAATTRYATDANADDLTLFVSDPEAEERRRLDGWLDGWLVNP